MNPLPSINVNYRSILDTIWAETLNILFEAQLKAQPSSTVLLMTSVLNIKRSENGSRVTCKHKSQTPRNEWPFNSFSCPFVYSTQFESWFSSLLPLDSLNSMMKTADKCTHIFYVRDLVASCELINVTIIRFTVSPRGRRDGCFLIFSQLWRWRNPCEMSR